MSVGHTLKLLLSLAGTPVLLLISPTITVYLSAQSELNYQVSVIYPFIVLAVAIYCIVSARYLLSGFVGRNQPATTKLSIPLAAYYLAGPFFLGFTLLRELPLAVLDQLPGIILATVVMLVIATYLAANVSRSAAISFFAVLSLAFTVAEGSRLFAGLEQADRPAEPSTASEFVRSGDASLPNIYHIILDGFHSDIFSLILTDEMKTQMTGFTWFENAAAIYDQTIWSIPSIMLGEKYDFLLSHQEYQSSAFNSDASLIHELSDAGYATFAYSRRLYQFDYDLFDSMTEHIDNMNASALDDQDDFVSLWIYRNLPATVSTTMAERDWLISRADIRNLGAQTFLAGSAALESRLSFDNILNEESQLPASGRYTFMHLTLPHDPFVLQGDCSEAKSSNVVAQSQCATQLVAEYLEELKSLGRYDDSLIIIHGDHGERYQVDGTNLHELEFRSHRTLLMLKPPLPAAQPTFETSSAAATLLDIAPSIYAFVGRQSPEHEGRSLLQAEHAEISEREAFFYIANGETSLRRHSIDGRSVAFEADIALPVSRIDVDAEIENAPLAPIDQVMEAEAGLLSKSVSVDSRIPGATGAYASNGKVSFRFELEEEASIQLRVRVIAPGANNNSSFVRIDGERSDVWHYDITRQWNWQAFDSKQTLSKGAHLLSIEYREQVYLDQLQLSIVNNP